MQLASQIRWNCQLISDAPFGADQQSKEADAAVNLEKMQLEQTQLSAFRR
jgi:hypothetical protein